MKQAVAERRVIRHQEYKAEAGRWREHHIHPSSQGVIVYTLDITDRKQLADSQREKEALLRSVGDHLPGAVYQAAVSPEGERRFQYISAGIEDLLGIKPEEVIANAMALYALIEPEDIGRVMAEEVRAFTSRSPFDCEFRQRTRAGELRWMHCRSAPRELPSGDVVWDGVVLDVTDRKRAEQALDRYRLLAEHTADIVLFFQHDGRIVDANAAAVAAYGYSREELLTLRLGDLRDSSTLPLLAEQMRQADEQGIVFETIHRRKSGESFPVEVSSRGTELEGRRVLLSIIRDITHRRRIELATHELAAIVESSGDAIVGTSLQGEITSWNAGATRLYGYEAHELIGQPIAPLIPPERMAEELSILQRVGQGEQVGPLETVRLARGGRRLEVAVTASPIRDDQGRIVGASKIARDIGEQKRTTQALRFLSEASKVLSASLDHEQALQRVAELVVPTLADWCAFDVLDADGQLRRVSVAHVDPAKIPLAHELQELARQGMASNRPQIIVGTGQSEQFLDIPAELIAAVETHWRVREIIEQLGLRSYVGVPLKFRDRTLGVLTLVSAESGRTFTESDIALAEDLAQRAAMAVANSRLYSEVSEASRRKDEFLATLAHELRNPLAPIRNAAELFRLFGQLPKELSEARNIVDRQVTQLTRLVDDLLDVSRFTRGKIVLRTEPLELSALVARALEMSQPMAAAAEQSLEVEEAAESIVLMADPTRIAQVIANLLNNSAKYTERGGRIRLVTRREGNTAVIEVSDNGIGIPADMLGRIFEPFAQVDSSLERSQGGLGIGLTLAKNLVEMHGGSIEAASDGRGRGSTFTVRLPLATMPPRQVPPVIKTSPTASRRILVADDNKDSADTLALLLRRLGHEVHAVYDGQAALALAERIAPDMFVLDIGMPIMSGYELARRLRSQTQFAQTMLVAMTGWGKEEDRQRTREAGFDHHLVKPVELEALKQLLAAIKV
jgi:PAS domain S-box-containing protein